MADTEEQPTEAIPAEPVTLGYRQAPKGAVVASEAALIALKKSRPWALGCAIGMFVYAIVGAVLGAMWLVVAIVQARNPNVGMAQFVIIVPPNLIGPPLAFVGGWLAIRYHAAAGRAFNGRSSEDLERAMIAQMLIWRWAGVAVLALFALPPLIIVTGFVLGVWR